MLLLPLVTAALVAQSLSITAAVAPRAEQFRYRFDNPSSFNTTELVPHFFEQRYDVVPLWFSADARYRIGATDAMTTAGVSLRRTTRGSDIDTFMQPSGDIATSGTDGPVQLRSWEVTQRLALARARGWSSVATFSYRRDTAEYLPDDRIVTHTMPPSITRTFITDRETTVSQVFAVGVEAERTTEISDRWRFTMGAGVQPMMQGRLMVRLPDKYPGVDLKFVALSGGGTVHGTLEHLARRWRAGITIAGAGARGYRQSSAYSLRSLSLTGFVGTRRR